MGMLCGIEGVFIYIYGFIVVPPPADLLHMVYWYNTALTLQDISMDSLMIWGVVGVGLWIYTQGGKE